VNERSKRDRAIYSGLAKEKPLTRSLASTRGWTLLTGDGELRSIAQAERVLFFGVLWLLDQLFDGHVIEAEIIVTGLETIAGHPRCRLPRAEIKARLERYRRRKT